MKFKKVVNFVSSILILAVSLSLLLLFFLAASGYIDMTSEPEIRAETNTTGVPIINASNHSAIPGDELEMKIFEEVNRFRQDHGVDPFVHSERVRLIARIHSADMGKMGYFDHSSLDGNNPRDRHDQYGGCDNPNENIARLGNFSTINTTLLSRKIVSLWRNSPGHYKSMMTPYDNVAGVGVYVTQNKSLYVTMNFCREHPNA